MPDPVIELVLFRTKPEVSDDALLAAAEDATRYLKGCRGFVRRRLARSADGEWADQIEWRSMADALEAAAHFNDSALTRRFAAAIESKSASVRHLTVHAAVG